MTQQTWFATITHPHRHLLATIAVWFWFVVALAGAAIWRELPVWLNGTAAASVSVWYVVMMRRWNAVRQPLQPPIDEEGS